MASDPTYFVGGGIKQLKLGHFLQQMTSNLLQIKDKRLFYKMAEETQVSLIILVPNFDVKLKKSIFLDFCIFYPPDLVGLWLDPKNIFDLNSP